MRMDHYGRMVDTLTDLWEELDRPDLIDEAGPVRKALEKVMTACVTAEKIRRARAQAIETRDAMAAAPGAARLRTVRAA